MRKADRQALALVGIVLCVLVVVLAVRWSAGGPTDPSAASTTTSTSASGAAGGGPSSSTAASSSAGTSTVGTPTAGTSTASATTPDPRPSTPLSGLPTIAESALPAEAVDTLDLIRVGGPYPYDEDDGVFGNREGLLPDQWNGYYREYTVETPGSDDRGARRIVAGEDGDRYYTDDHYDSFRQIEEGR